MAALLLPQFGVAEDQRLLVARIFLWFLLVLGVVQLLVNLIRSVLEVNAEGTPPDTTPWELSGDAGPRDEPAGGDTGEPR